MNLGNIYAKLKKELREILGNFKNRSPTLHQTASGQEPSNSTLDVKGGVTSLSKLKARSHYW